MNEEGLVISKTTEKPPPSSTVESNKSSSIYPDWNKLGNNTNPKASISLAILPLTVVCRQAPKLEGESEEEQFKFKALRRKTHSTKRKSRFV
jgi:hypothetical protein